MALHAIAMDLDRGFLPCQIAPHVFLNRGCSFVPLYQGEHIHHLQSSAEPFLQEDDFLDELMVLHLGEEATGQLLDLVRCNVLLLHKESFVME